MPTHTTNYTADQYAYIHSSKADDQSFSDRAREVTLMGIAVEKAGLFSAGNFKGDAEDGGEAAEEAIREVVSYYLNNHPEAKQNTA